MKTVRISGKYMEMEYELQKFLKGYLKKHKKQFHKDFYNRSISIACTLVDILIFFGREEKINKGEVCEILFTFIDIAIVNMLPKNLNKMEVDHIQQYFNKSKLMSLNDYYKTYES